MGMNKQIQAKHIPDQPILEFLLEHLDDHWCNWFEADSCDRSVRHAMPAETPDKVVLAKMRSMIRRGLVDGCACGCRGDFEITPEGAAHLTSIKRS